jgi:3-oxoadipate enol-lactonase
MPTIQVRDIEMYYERSGTGPRLLCIGGSGGDLRGKPGTFDGPLVEHFDLLCFDQRGLGQTDAPEGPYTMADYGEDAAALITALDFAPCLVMGVSFGGMVAQELVCRHPQLVTGLVLACTSPGGPNYASYPLHTLTDLGSRERAIATTEISDTRYDAQWREAHPTAAENLLNLIEGRSKPQSEKNLRGMALQLEARSHHDTCDRLHEVSIPTYICAGERDGIAPPVNQHMLASLLPNSKLEMFDGGHWFLMQDRTAFGKIIDFVKACA